MTVREALVKGTDILKNAGVEAPAVDAGVMLCHILNRDRTWLYAHGDENLDVAGAESYSLLLVKRSTGMPVQYIIGKQEFMGLDFHVAPEVLIPRHDTETVVEKAMELGRRMRRGAKILDMGTGSGCIAISLAYYLKDCFAAAVDISGKALEIARLNAISNSVARRMEFIRSNLFDRVNMTGFDMIVSNPPYIRHSEIPYLERKVRDFEPALALDGGRDGLAFYREIIAKAPEFLREKGYLAFEVGINQSADVANLMWGSFKDISIMKDLAGIERVVTGKLY